jgi:glutamate racemase
MIDKSNHPIGIFDSGIGGLSVLKEAVTLLPNEDFIYFCDSKNVPYGDKKPNELKQYIDESIAFLIEKRVKAIVLACNTATSIAIDSLREKYNIPIIGMEPAVKPALGGSKGGKVIVLATPVTLEQEKFSKLKEKIDKFHEVVVLPAENLASMIEKHLMENYKKNAHSDKIENYLTKLFSHFDLSNILTVVLGCTHYLFIKKYLEKILPKNVSIIDGNNGTVNHLKNILIEKDLINNKNESGKIKFYSSGHDFVDINRIFSKIIENYL